MCNTQGSKKQAKYTCCDGLRAPASMMNPPRADCASDCEPPELCLEDIDFHDSRHVSLLAVLSRSNDFYYIDRTRFLNIKDNCQLASPTGSAHGILAFERGKAVAFIIYHKFDDTNPLHQIYTHPTIEIQFHLVDSKCRRRSIGSALLQVVESQHEMRVICVEVDSSLDSAPYYTKMGYNLNFVTHPFFGHKVTYGRKASPLHPHIQHYYKLHLSFEINTKIRTLMDQLPQEDRRVYFSQIVEGLKKRQQAAAEVPASAVAVLVQ